MRREPKASGGCAVCGKPRGRTIPKTASKPARARLVAMLASDPFCSAACARLFHRVDFARDEQEKAPGGELDWEVA